VNDRIDCVEMIDLLIDELSDKKKIKDRFGATYLLLITNVQI
jgi:hypothetical protein